ncbi:MAG: helix-turn-helix transcriptional regulator [Ruminococcaceae bacterium]|nr:helix-turn-helix transcriptional regulator [Oscillospiraceae bacterium]
MNLSESIRHFRTMRNLTQEELGNAISISPQAISKWERGESMPDASLLPALADTLDVSLDRLYGREKFTMDDIMTAIPAYLQTLPKEERMTGIRTISLIADILSKNSFRDCKNQLAELIQNGASEYNSVLNTAETGFTIASLRSELPFWAVFCEPKNGWGAVLKPEERYRDVFAVLADKQALNTLFSLFNLPNGFSFDESYAAEQYGLTNAEETLQKLRKLRTVYYQDISIDGKITRIWFYRQQIGLISLFALLNEQIYYQNSFAWQQNARSSALFRPITTKD